MSTVLEKVVAGEVPPFVPLTADQYVQMADAGILPATPRVELIDGLLILKDRRDAGGDIMTVGNLHVLVGLKLNGLLAEKLRDTGFHARHQAPVFLPPLNVPEPDVSVAIGTIDDYASRFPDADDLALVVEVAYSSIRTDRETKLHKYAAAGIGLYWIVNLEESIVEVYGEPVRSESRYAVEERVDRSGQLRLPLAEMNIIEIAVAEFLPE
ncbi:MAG: Uma2 family endonuclease [Planctomycetaceae bacterium]